MNKIKVISLVFLVVIGATIFGCQAKAEDPYHKVSLDGSTSMEKLMNALREGVSERISIFTIRTTVYWF